MSIAALLLASTAAANPSADEAMARVFESLHQSHEITLVSPGAKPHRVLKFAPKPGTVTEQTIVNAQKMDMSIMGPDGQAMPMPMGQMSPVVSMGMRQEIGQPVASGLVPVRIGYTSVSVDNVPPQMQEAMQQGMEPMMGTSFRMLMDPKTGKITQVDVDSSASDELYQAMQSMADGYMQNMAQFPAEPVGQGAKWTIEMTMGVAGMDLLASNEVTLVALKGDEAVLEYNLTMTRGDSQMALPGLPPGASMDFTRFDATGQGRYTTNLATMASTGSMTTNIDMAVSADIDGQKLGMDMKMEQKTEMRAK